jgi:hypothetical protein
MTHHRSRGNASSGREQGRGRKIVDAGRPNEVDLRPTAPAGLLEIGLKRAIEKVDAREVLDAREAHIGQIAQEAWPGA